MYTNVLCCDIPALCLLLNSGYCVFSSTPLLLLGKSCLLSYTFLCPSVCQAHSLVRDRCSINIRYLFTSRLYLLPQMKPSLHKSLVEMIWLSSHLNSHVSTIEILLYNTATLENTTEGLSSDDNFLPILKFMSIIFVSIIWKSKLP